MRAVLVLVLVLVFVTAHAGSALASTPATDSDHCTLTVEVIDGAQKPVAGAKITVKRQKNFVTLDTLVGKTDAKGRAVFKARHGYLHVSAMPKAFIPRAVVERCGHTRQTPTAKLQLKPAGPIPVSGKVTSAEGVPPGVEVSVVEILDDRSKKLFPYPTPVPLDPKTGAYGFTVVPGRAYRLYATAPGYRFVSRDFNLDPTRPNLISDVKNDAKVVQLDMAMRREATVKARVTLPDGTAAKQASVFVGPMSAMGPSLSHTDAKGDVELAVVSKKDLVVTARMGRYVGFVEVPKLAMGGRTEVRIALSLGRVIQGTAMLPRELKAERATTRVFYRVRRLGLWGYTFLDDQLRFKVGGMPKAETVEVFCEKTLDQKAFRVRYRGASWARLVRVKPSESSARVICGRRKH